MRDELFALVRRVSALVFQLQQVAQPHQIRAILLAAGGLAFDEHFEAEEGHPHAFDRDRLGCRDGVRVAHLPRLAAHVHLDLVGDFHGHIFRDVLRREFGGGVVFERGEAGDAPLEILDGVFHEDVHILRRPHMAVEDAGMAADDEVACAVLYRHNHYCKTRPVSAKQASFALWYDRGGQEGDIKAFDTFYRKVRNTINKIEKAAFVVKVPGTRGYVLRTDFKATHVL